MPLFFFSSFQHSWQKMFNIKLADDWIRTAEFGIGSEHSTNWANTTALPLPSFVVRRIAKYNRGLDLNLRSR